VAAAGSRSRTRLGILALASALLLITGIVAWLIASTVFGLGAFVLTTNSMSPSIPNGSLAIVQHIDAGAVAVGDVVTVPRTVNAPPVTQRVIAEGTVNGETQLTIRGDAYTTGGGTYSVQSVDRVIATVPLIGDWLRTILRPVVLAPLTALIVVASMWVLWPEAPQAPSRHRGTHVAARG
jgi:signal peptidase I